MHNRNLLHEQGTHVATVGVVLEYFRRQGLSALEVKKLFSPDAVDAWFKAKADAFERATRVNTNPPLASMNSAMTAHRCPWGIKNGGHHES